MDTAQTGTARSRPLPHRILALVSLLAIAGRPVTQDVSGAGTLPQEPAPPVGLGELTAEPTRLLGETVTFALQFDGIVESWNPCLSRFAPAGWIGFRAWPDESFTWERDAYLSPATRLFVRKGSPEAALLSRANRFERFHVTAHVREVFLDEPWIEITSLRLSHQHVPEGSILHMERALVFENKGQFELAIDQMERAASAPLPPHAMLEIGRRIAACREAKRLLERERERRR